MALPKSFRSFADFEREMIRPAYAIGLSLEDMVEDTSFEAELDFDQDPFEASDDDDY
jgi:hypothetical protein